MTWTYLLDFTLRRDQVRYLVQDTNSADPLVQDEEIVFAVAQESNLYLASSLVAKTIAAQFSRQANFAVDTLRVELNNRAKFYFQLSEELATRGGGVTMAPVAGYAGGISHAERNTARQDDDLIQPDFPSELFNSTLSAGDGTA